MPVHPIDQKKLAKIVNKLAKGIPLAVICRERDMPAVRTVSWWKTKHPEVREALDDAREAGHDAIAWRMTETAAGRGDSKGDVVRDKLLIETWVKLLAKWNSRYSDKLEVNVTQTIEIGAALADARARLVRPLNDLLPAIEGESRSLEGPEEG